jgi:hypothetical protein
MTPDAFTALGKVPARGQLFLRCACAEVRVDPLVTVSDSGANDMERSLV